MTSATVLPPACPERCRSVQGEGALRAQVGEHDHAVRSPLSGEFEGVRGGPGRLLQFYYNGPSTSLTPS